MTRHDNSCILLIKLLEYLQGERGLQTSSDGWMICFLFAVKLSAVKGIKWMTRENVVRYEGEEKGNLNRLWETEIQENCFCSCKCTNIKRVAQLQQVQAGTIQVMTSYLRTEFLKYSSLNVTLIQKQFPYQFLHLVLLTFAAILICHKTKVSTWHLFFSRQCI